MYNGKNTLFETKTTNDALTGAQFTLTNGKPRRIIITTFSEDMKSLYQAGLVVWENDGYQSNKYVAGSFSSAGTKVAISYGDYDGGVGLYYSTDDYIRYY
ncbi:hypothetical protein [Candidatus Stoquefichus massiliensis]|uniref:hypothetical protein n=1 Tax=Candidatus Stoquefichus massiliensis TaxID=1470350 RepID=UPI0004897FAF|nr:hypothetical protein [Candidatus Stoquefichus massiliensis]